MVVIGIIGLLISIALPAFQNARRQAGRTVTQQMMTTLDVGLQSYNTEGKAGGSFPPSITPENTPNNPHIPGGSIDLNYAFGGANLLAWGLVGADLQGTPGFKDLDGGGANDDAFGGWTDNCGRNNPAVANDPQLYDLNAAGSPLYTRYGPYVEVSKLKLPKPVAGTNYYELGDLDGKPRMSSICFLDSFGGPILYYKANRGAPSMVDMADGVNGNVQEYYKGNGSTYVPTGIYNLRDNSKFTGYTDSSGSTAPEHQGLDLGGGAPHPMARLGPYWSGNLPNDWATQLRDAKGSFAYRVWNQNVTATPRPHREDSYILISAGPDGRYGTGDDVANFPIED